MIKLIDINTKEKFDNITKEYINKGFSWGSDFLDIQPSFEEARQWYHGNSKLLLHVYYNDINNKFEMQVTTLTTINSYPQYKNITSKDVIH